MYKLLLAILLISSSNLFAQSWSQLGDSPVARHHPISFSLDGKGYAITGTLSTTDNPSKVAYEYDPATDTWTSLPDFPGAARSFGIGTVTNGLAYIGFGASNTQYFNDMWSFEPSTGTWTQLANCSCTGRRHPAMIATEEKIYVGLGDGAIGDLDSWAVYDIASNTWTNIADLPGPGRHHPYMFNAGDEIFAGLGHSGPNIYNDWYQLDKTTNTWTELSLFPGESRVAGTQFSIGDFGYVLSGDGDDHDYMDTGEMWRYNSSNDTWLELTPHPGVSIWAPGSFVIDYEVYFFGGLNRFSNVFPTSVYKYSDPSLVPVVEPEPPTSITNGADKVLNNYSYPNPADNFIQLVLEDNITEVKIFNTIGSLITTNSLESNKINTEELENGLYLIQFYNGSKLASTSKFIIQH